MPTRDLTFAIIGSGGDGVVTAGDMLAQAGASVGLHVMKVEAYGPQIRGGESSCTVRVSADPIFAQADLVQVLVVFNWADFGQFRGEILAAPDAVVLYEETDDTPREEIDLGPETDDVRWVPVPFIELAKESAGTKLAKNIVTLGLLSEMFSLPQKPIELAIKGVGWTAKVQLARTGDPGGYIRVVRGEKIVADEELVNQVVVTDAGN